MASSVVRRSARLSAAFACADAARSASSDSRVVFLCVDERIQEVGGFFSAVHVSAASILDAADRGPRVHQHQFARGDRVDQRRHHVLDAPRGAHRGHPVGRRRHHLTQAPLVTAGDANLFGTFGFEQSRVLETHVGQLPQQVIEQHEAARCGHARVGVVEPQHVIGRTRCGPFTAADPDRGGAPGRAAAHHRTHLRVIGATDPDHDVAGPHRHPHQIDQVRSGQRDGRQRPLSHDHRMHELDRDVQRMRLPRRRDGPHGGARREPLGQCEGGRGQIGGQLGAKPAIDRGGGHRDQPLPARSARRSRPDPAPARRRWAAPGDGSAPRIPPAATVVGIPAAATHSGTPRR